eukprot:gnl/MRDRNA2_/MRDRNA2_131561_c0_seq1.p1 gnl/MRDRNA2_/MRDRNA2_131561_c0~~gnl/MRDRNA2_/MRDRNA2_131561_c0_seq1.p1  ORF type:complete len:259 (-),score=35.23 gnl/MRDRNA2_/MRDRNA2_131561_c0_seq1:52-762(-)
MPRFFTLCFTYVLVEVHALGICPGQPQIEGNVHCNITNTRVCLKVLRHDDDDSWTPLTFTTKSKEKKNYWEITNQTHIMQDEVNLNEDTSQCVSMWASTKLIKAIGCKQVPLECGASDIGYVLDQFMDEKVSLGPLRECLRTRCCPGGKCADVEEVDKKPTPSKSSSIFNGLWDLGYFMLSCMVQLTTWIAIILGGVNIITTGRFLPRKNKEDAAEQSKAERREASARRGEKEKKK